MVGLWVARFSSISVLPSLTPYSHLWYWSDCAQRRLIARASCLKTTKQVISWSTHLFKQFRTNKNKFYLWILPIDKTSKPPECVQMWDRFSVSSRHLSHCFLLVNQWFFSFFQSIFDYINGFSNKIYINGFSCKFLISIQWDKIFVKKGGFYLSWNRKRDTINDDNFNECLKLGVILF